MLQGDLIGTDLWGKAAIPNGSDGVQLINTHSNTVGGGTTVESRNIIAGNAGSGVDIIGASSDTVAGNSIGVGLGGSPLGNQGDGVRITASSSFNMVGGTDPSSTNVIAYNGGNGVTVGADPSDQSIGNSILENSIVANGLLGIDLGDDGPTPNTPGGPHDGPNQLQNTPVLASVSSDSNSTTIQGSLNSAPDTIYRIELFDNASGGQGQTFLGFVDVTTDDSGNAVFVFNTTTQLAPGDVVTATATDLTGDTSEFSAGMAVA